MTEKSTRKVKSIGAVIPIYRPGELFPEVLGSLLRQTYKISQLLIIDSSPPADETGRSTQGKARSAFDFETEYLRILPEEFDHGGTRNLGAQHLGESGEVDAVLFLTQDALMLDDCLERLVAFLEENELAAAFARQLPRKGAGVLETADRLKGYPAESWVSEGKPQSIDDAFFSDVCSLIRLDAFAACGGFPDKIITAEDMILAIRLLENGFRVGYCAQAEVEHSHTLGFWRLLKRYFDIGVMHSERQDQVPVKTAANRGAGLVIYQAQYLIKHEPLSLWRLLPNVVGKYAGYQLGRHYLFLPVWLRLKFSQNRQYWLGDKAR